MSLHRCQEGKLSSLEGVALPNLVISKPSKHFRGNHCHGRQGVMDVVLIPCKKSKQDEWKTRYNIGYENLCIQEKILFFISSEEELHIHI